MKAVVRRATYYADLNGIERYIARDNPIAATALWFEIDDQVALLADPNHPRRKGVVRNTMELVAHLNYIVIFEEDDTAVDVLNVVHARRQYP